MEQCGAVILRSARLKEDNGGRGGGGGSTWDLLGSNYRDQQGPGLTREDI